MTKFIIGISVLTSSFLCAQKNNVYVGAGDATLNRSISFLDKIFKNDYPVIKEWSGFQNNKEKDISHDRLITTGYRYVLTDRIKVGLDLAYSTNKTYYLIENNYTKDKVTTVVKDQFYIIMPTASYSYIKKGLFDFYGTLSAGVAFNKVKYSIKNNNSLSLQNPDQSSTLFAYQITPAGLRVGKKIGGFVEAGFGYKAVLVAGIDYKF
ncbi:hypothetical protein [Chryseobacterium sp. OSA05B]|uniref:hypothetical protein n=1 Tax=Chryseobacterium sp. OSA05B TaxID=2862650 RepID=UPI001CBC20A7|nr:hypothetical protein [Chryseobacterium sp. OSA05B]